MNTSDSIQITIHDDFGATYDEFKSRFEGKELFGSRIEVSKHLQESVAETAIIGLLLTISWKVFNRVLDRLSEDIGDKIYEGLRDRIRELFVSTDDNSELALEIRRSLPDQEIAIRIRPTDLQSDNFDSFLSALSGPIAQMLIDMRLPTESTSNIDIQFSIGKGVVMEMKATDWSLGRDYTFDFKRSKWQLTFDRGSELP